MIYPNKKTEKNLIKQGFINIAGIDEAGRGAWAGPVVAAAVILPVEIKIKGVKDSKLLRHPDRLAVYKKIVEMALDWSVGVIEREVIDNLGLAKANLMAMELAVKNLKLTPGYLLIDGYNQTIGKFGSQGIIDGDYKVASIAAASIIAKITRDNILDQLDEQFPAYGFKQHKGYGTNHHFQMLVKHGVSPIHRQSFKPIQDILGGNQ